MLILPQHIQPLEVNLTERDGLVVIQLSRPATELTFNINDAQDFIRQLSEVTLDTYNRHHRGGDYSC